VAAGPKPGIPGADAAALGAFDRELGAGLELSLGRTEGGATAVETPELARGVGVAGRRAGEGIGAGKAGWVIVGVGVGAGGGTAGRVGKGVGVGRGAGVSGSGPITLGVGVGVGAGGRRYSETWAAAGVASSVAVPARRIVRRVMRLRSPCAWRGWR
jgi:hypothetical protein